MNLYGARGCLHCALRKTYKQSMVSSFQLWNQFSRYSISFVPPNICQHAPLFSVLFLGFLYKITKSHLLSQTSLITSNSLIMASIENRSDSTRKHITLEFEGELKEGAHDFFKLVNSGTFDIRDVRSLYVTINAGNFSEFEDDMYASALAVFHGQSDECPHSLESLRIIVYPGVLLTRNSYFVISPAASWDLRKKEKSWCRLLRNELAPNDLAKLHCKILVHSKALITALLKIRGVKSVSVRGPVERSLRRQLKTVLTSPASADATSFTHCPGNEPDAGLIFTIQRETTLGDGRPFSKMTRIGGPAQTCSGLPLKALRSSETYNFDTYGVYANLGEWMPPLSPEAQVELGWVVEAEE